MTTFHQLILKCPHCGTLMSAHELMSYTVHRSESWSDGKTDIGVCGSDDISICAVCRQVFWKDDARLPEDPDRQAGEDLASVMEMYELEWQFDDDRDEKAIGFYVDMLNDDFADNDVKEFYVRTRIWWAVNDLIRHLSSWRSASNPGMLRGIIIHRRKVKKLFDSYGTLFDENLDRLIFLLIKSADIDLLYLANMYRERCSFSKAAEILEKAEDKGRTWKKLRKKVRKKDGLVFRL